LPERHYYKYARSSGQSRNVTKEEGDMPFNIIKTIGNLFKGSRVTEISADELLKKINQSETFTIIDVRNHADFIRGHIPGAICLPLADVKTGYKELDSTKAVIVY
jgi:hypothetical protein